MSLSSTLATETSSAEQRFDNWVLERVRQRRGPTELPLTFEYRHIYVMPTRFGFWFGFLLALTALGGLNFNNNMTLMLGFLLAAIAQLTTLLAYRNRTGLDDAGAFPPRKSLPSGSVQGMGSHHTEGTMPGLPQACDKPASLAPNGPGGVWRGTQRRRRTVSRPERIPVR
jgi:hypothetical protein